MTRITLGKARAVITATGNGLQVVIPSRKNAFLILFLAAWLVGWAVGEVMVPTTFIKGIKDTGALIFSAAWLVAWTIGGGFAIYTWLWNVAGKEIITVNSLYLTVKKDLFGYGRVKEYEMSHITNLRVSPQPFNPFDVSSSLQFWGVGGGVLAFDYGSRTYRFCRGVDEAEATQVMGRIKEYHKE
ncbi:MAG: hypothetical protein WC291_10980 [Thermodesulfovibrionales bacterium]|jgi:hypothetical protein